MSAIVIKYPCGLSAESFEPLRLALLQIAQKHGLKVVPSCHGLQYDLQPVHEPCKVVPFKRAPAGHTPNTTNWPHPAA